jgi:hypothetical protein
LVAGIPGAISYETPKLWIVQKSRKERLSVLDLLDNLPAVRAAFETLHAVMKAAARSVDPQ